MSKKKILMILAGGALMIGGDYLTAYFEELTVFFTGELVALAGWAVFIIALENDKQITTTAQN